MAGDRCAAPFTDLRAAVSAARTIEAMLAPAAARLLGAADASVWLHPLWRQLAGRASALGFERDFASGHAAASWLRAQDWQLAAQAVAGIGSWRRIPVPLSWMAQARWQLQGTDATWPLLAELAWLAPQLFAGCLKAMPDRVLQRLALRLEADFEPPSSDAAADRHWAWLPAWALTHEPRLAGPMETAQVTAHDGAACRGWQAMQSLLRLERQVRHGEIVAERARLRDIDAGLFSAYLRDRR